MAQVQSPVTIPQAPHGATDQSRQIATTITEAIFGPLPQRNFIIRYWDGSEETPPQEAQFTLILRHPSSLRHMLLPPSETNLAEGYLHDDFDIEGNVEAAVAASFQIAERIRSPRKLASLITHVLKLPAHDAEQEFDPTEVGPRLAGSRHSRQRDAAAIKYHYDVGNDFYAAWLDARMVYSCGYFPTGAEDLDTAQTAKLEHICRKLRLQPGERLLDIGCGWGGLIQYAAEHYGVSAVGITLSPSQAEIARQRIDEAGLTDCRVEVRDYRDLPTNEPFDKIVSVGMFEHVGRAKFADYFNTAYRLLQPGGLFLNHYITLGVSDPLAGHDNWALRKLWRPGEFIWKYVFPDGELYPITESLHASEVGGFEIRDVENLREHYALTLRHWVSRLEAKHDELVAMVGEPTYRIWRLYMAASAQGFVTGRTAIIQALLSKPGPNGECLLPPTRADLYR